MAMPPGMQLPPGMTPEQMQAMQAQAMQQQQQQAQPAARGAKPAAARRPTTVPTVKLPDGFEILKKRNAFAHGKPGAADASAAKGPESTFVFRGAVNTIDHLTAFVEDTSSKRVLELAVGATVARGQIRNIDLDAVTYEAPGGASKRIEVGQNFNGEAVPPTPPPAKPAGPQPPPGAQPGQPGQPAPGGPGQPAQAAPRVARGATVTKSG
jgi:hypothetical protein